MQGVDQRGSGDTVAEVAETFGGLQPFLPMAALQRDGLFFPEGQAGKEVVQCFAVRRFQAVGDFHEEGESLRRIALQNGNHGRGGFASGEVAGDHWFGFAAEIRDVLGGGLGLEAHHDGDRQHEGAHRREDEGNIPANAQKFGA